MKTYQKIILWSAVVGAVVVGVLLNSKKTIQYDEPNPIVEIPCNEGQSKQINGNYFTCVGGEWIFTGSEFDNKG